MEDSTLLYREEDEGDWYFTFGHGQKNAGCYVKIRGTLMGTRQTMFRHFGEKWSQQYPGAEEAGVNRWNLSEIPLPPIRKKPEPILLTIVNSSQGDGLSVRFEGSATNVKRELVRAGYLPGDVVELKLK